MPNSEEGNEEIYFPSLDKAVKHSAFLPEKSGGRSDFINPLRPCREPAVIKQHEENSHGRGVGLHGSQTFKHLCSS